MTLFRAEVHQAQAAQWLGIHRHKCTDRQGAEVHQAQAAQWLGSVRLHRPLSFAMLTTAALGLALVTNGAPGQQQATLQAQLFAPSRTAGFVRPGQTVYLRYAAYPYQKFGLHTGHITSVSATPFAPSELPANLAQQLIAQAGSNEALYRINVQLDVQSIQAYGEPMLLKAGLTLEADVLQERRKVWEWVLAGVGGTCTAQSSGCRVQGSLHRELTWACTGG